MSARSVQAGRFGHELACEVGLKRVDIRWSGSPRKSGYGGWRVEWTDGPTALRMRCLVEVRASRFPEVPVEELGYDRCSTNLAEAVAFLLYVDRHRDWVQCIESPVLLRGYDEIDSPERADELWQNRAKALLRYARRPITTLHAVRILARQAQVGWDSAMAWLDQLAANYAAEHEAPNVVNLAGWRNGGC